jgi:signal peptidase I
MSDSRASRIGKRVASAALVLVVVAGWFHWLMPQTFGGRAGWVLVSGKSMLPHYRSGDLVLVERQASYHVGEVIAYRVPQGDPMAGLQVIHRIVGGDARHGFVTQGDNRTGPDTWRPTTKDIVGAKLLRVPDGLLAITMLRSPLLLGLLAASFVFVFVLTHGRGDEEAGRDLRDDPVTAPAR